MNTQFWKDTAERAIKTFCQSLVGALGAGASGLIGIDWVQALSIAGFATLVSILTSIGSIKIGDEGTAGIVKRSNINLEDD